MPKLRFTVCFRPVIVATTTLLWLLAATADSAPVPLLLLGQACPASGALTDLHTWIGTHTRPRTTLLRHARPRVCRLRQPQPSSLHDWHSPLRLVSPVPHLPHVASCLVASPHVAAPLGHCSSAVRIASCKQTGADCFMQTHRHSRSSARLVAGASSCTDSVRASSGTQLPRQPRPTR